MDKRGDRLGLVGSMLFSLTIILLSFYLIGHLAFNSDNTFGLTRLLTEFESNGVLQDLSDLTETLSSLKIPKIESVESIWSWLNPVIEGLNMIIGFFTSMLSFMSVIIVFLLGAFSLI